MLLDETMKRILRESAEEHNITYKQAEDIYKTQMKLMRDCLTNGDRKNFDSFISFKLFNIGIFRATEGLFKKIHNLTKTSVIGAEWDINAEHPGIDNTLIEITFQEALFNKGDIITPGVTLKNVKKGCRVVEAEGFTIKVELASGDPNHFIPKEQLYPGYKWRKII